jgi:uncharacterized membrane protein
MVYSFRPTSHTPTLTDPSGTNPDLLSHEAGIVQFSWSSLALSVISNTADHLALAIILIFSYLVVSLINRGNWAVKSRLKIEEMSAERRLIKEEEEQREKVEIGWDADWDATEW